MKHRFLKVTPVAVALVLLSGTQLHAFGNFALSDEVVPQQTDTFTETVKQQKQAMFLVCDADIMQDSSSVSSVLEREPKGSQVNVLDVEGDTCKVLTATGKTGYVPVSKLVQNRDYIFDDTDQVKYVNADNTEVKKLPFAQSSTVTTLPLDTEVHLTGTNESEYWRIDIDGTVSYIDKAALSDQKTVQGTPPAAVQNVPAANTAAEVPAVVQTAAVQTGTTWNGSSLTPFAGSVMGPSGKETYYNLDMSGCVANMRGIGNTDEYWVRSDGVKMLGNYVMIAADFATRPLGSYVETSLGTGIVVDTGTFAYSNPSQIDIAVTW